jgi:hypothetical protein
MSLVSGFEICIMLGFVFPGGVSTTVHTAWAVEREEHETRKQTFGS